MFLFKYLRLALITVAALMGSTMFKCSFSGRKRLLLAPETGLDSAVVFGQNLKSCCVFLSFFFFYSIIQNLTNYNFTASPVM